MKATRRDFLQHVGTALLAPGAAISLVPAFPTNADEPAFRHGLSPFGDLKYPSGFSRFDYVNPAAPKGGLVREAALGTYDNFNIVVAGLKGNLGDRHRSCL